MTPHEAMQRIDAQLAHVWMVRTFVKHAPEAEEDDELRAVPRELYDFALALGQAWKDQDAAAYLHIARKKLTKLRSAAAEFAELQPEVSSHTNFEMAVRSLATAVEEIARILDGVAKSSSGAPASDEEAPRDQESA